jgi:VanZ family protein
VDSVPTSPSLDQSTSRPSAVGAHLSRFRLAMAIFWTLVIMTLCWLPREAVHQLEDESSWFKVPNFDKLVHAGIFVVFAVLWTRVWSAPRRFVWTALAGLSLAVITEVVQGLPVVGRDASVADALTDVAGVLIGFMVAPHIEPIARSVESRMFRKNPSRALQFDQSPAVPDEGSSRSST